MQIIDTATYCGVQPKKVAGTNGGEYASACPMCGGKDRFRVWPEQGKSGKYWCRSCDKKGDAIQLLRDVKGMGYKEACAFLGVEASMSMKAPHSTIRPLRKQGDGWKPRKTNAPADKWQQNAKAFIDSAHKELLGNREQLAWLAERGINPETARRYRLGWNPKDLYYARSTWGLDKDGKKIWLPEGLVIPFVRDDKIVRVRFRRPEGEPRYLLVAGSGMEAMVIQPQKRDRGKEVWVVVESELDALLIAQEIGDITGAMSLGNSSAKPDEAAYEVLQDAAQILVAYDFDDAGAKAWGWWAEHFTQADRWPVPDGKDPGDYREKGGDVREWIIKGLSPGLKPYTPTVAAAAPKPVVKEPISPEERQDKLIPVRHIKGACPVCKKPLDVYVFKGSPARTPCFSCIPVMRPRLEQVNG